MPVHRTAPSVALVVLAALSFGGCGKLDTSPTLADPAASASAAASAEVRDEGAAASRDDASVDQLRAENLANAPALGIEILKRENGRVVELRVDAKDGALTRLGKLGALDALRRLSIRAGEIDAGSAPERALSNLEYLDLSGNLGTLPDWVTRLPKLTTLSLMLNQLDQLPASLSQLQSLRGLHVSNNAFTTIPESVLALRQLQILQFGNCQLTSLPEGLRELQQLRTLSVGVNQLSDLPPAVFELGLLEALSAQKNQIKRLSPEIGKLKRLTSLKLHDNQLTTLPKELRDLPLQYLMVERNRISDAEGLAKRIFGREPPPTWALEPQLPKPKSR